MGCAALDPCPLHGRAVERAAYERLRGSAASLGYDRTWRDFRQWYFGELYRLKVARAGLCGCRHPSAPPTRDSVCARDQRPDLATVVDHIIPITGRADPRRLDVTNLQGLCDRCHNQKRQREAVAAQRRR